GRSRCSRYPDRCRERALPDVILRVAPDAFRAPAAMTVLFHDPTTSATCRHFCCSSCVRSIASTASSRVAGGKGKGLPGRLLRLARLAVIPPAARAAQRRIPTLAPSNTVIDGPSADVLSIGGMAVARDGTGGVAYLKNVGGAPHVFVSRLLA